MKGLLVPKLLARPMSKKVFLPAGALRLARELPLTILRLFRLVP